MTPNDIHSKRFDKSVAGYKIEDVNAFLMEVGDYVEQLYREKNDAEEKLMVLADKLEEYRTDEESLRAALIGAQKLGDSVVRESKRKAEALLSQATKQAEQIVGDAKRSIDNEAVALTRMQMEVAKFKTQILNMYKQHIEMINNIPFDEEKLPKQPEPVREKAVPVQAEETEPQAVEAEEIPLEFEEVEAGPDVDEGDIFPQRKKTSRYGALLFGDEYDLKRED